MERENEGAGWRFDIRTKRGEEKAKGGPGLPPAPRLALFPFQLFFSPVK
jgi:hypothetical protein